MTVRKFFIFIILLLAANPCLALENLDELEAREGRRTTNTFYSGESGSPWYWQPMTVCYKEVQDSAELETEICRITNGKNGESGHHSEEYGYWSVWNANGERIAIGIDTDQSSAFVRDATGRQRAVYFTLRSDYTKYRVAEDNVFRTNERAYDWGWSPTEPDVAYGLGYNGEGEGYNPQWLYKRTVADASITVAQWIDLGDTTQRHIGKTIAPDGKRAVAFSWYNDANAVVLDLTKSDDADGLIVSWDFTSTRNWDIDWGDTVSTGTSFHNARLTGSKDNGYWLYVLQSEAAQGGGHTWWRTRLTDDVGTAGPIHTQDTTSTYDWWTGTAAQTEMQPLGGNNFGTNLDPWCDDGVGATECVEYTSHPFHNVDGGLVVYEDTDTINRHSVYDYDNRVYIEEGIGTHITSQHPNWNAWSDYAVGWPHFAQSYALLIDPHNDTVLDWFSNHEEDSDTLDEGINQSPDGTKGIWGSSFLQAGSGQEWQDLFVAVAYYPYPPEITAASATGGTVTVTFDYRTDQATSRGYTQRGWPDEDSDDPPPPREIEKARLWRCGPAPATCTDTAGTWTPLGTVDLGLWEDPRYNYSTGAWTGLKYWEITDSPGSGTWYYGVTSVEYSGLESHALSNIWSVSIGGGNVETTSYPTSPGDLDDIGAADYTIPTGDVVTITGYDIHAKDITTPTYLDNRDRIASISEKYCPDSGTCEWVDWLGNTDGSTQYVVLARYSNGTFSNAALVTNQDFEHCGGVGDCTELTPVPASNGQYRIYFDNVQVDHTGTPTVTGATIDVTGLELTLNISETVDVNNNTGWTINTSYSPIPTVTYQGGTGTAILVYDISRSIYADETVTVSYNKPAADAIESVADEDLESFGPTAVTNNSGVPHVALSGGVGGIGSFGGF